MKNDASKVANKIEIYDDADDIKLNFLVDKLENLITKIDKKVFERKTRQLPRGNLLFWDGSVEKYHDFKLQMTNMLIYDSEYLNLSTLTNQIKFILMNNISDHYKILLMCTGRICFMFIINFCSALNM